MALFDDEDEGIEDDASDTNKNGASNKSTPVGTPKRPNRKAKKSQSPRPEPKGNLAFKPEKSIWDSPFLAADRGLDSAYPSSHSSDQSKGSDESDHGDIINKFGMAAAFSNAVREAEEAERRSVSMCSDDIQPEADELKVSYTKKEPSPERAHTLEVGSSYRASPSRDSISSSGSGKSGNSKKKSGKSGSNKDKRWKPTRTEKKPEAEQALMSELSVSVGSSIGNDEARGQVSPVFIEDPGESSDFNSSINSNSKFLFRDVLTSRADEASSRQESESSTSRVESFSLSDSARSAGAASAGEVNLALEETPNPYDAVCEELDDWKADIFSMVSL